VVHKRAQPKRGKKEITALLSSDNRNARGKRTIKESNDNGRLGRGSEPTAREDEKNMAKKNLKSGQTKSSKRVTVRKYQRAGSNKVEDRNSRNYGEVGWSWRNVGLAGGNSLGGD